MEQCKSWRVAGVMIFILGISIFWTSYLSKEKSLGYSVLLNSQKNIETLKELNVVVEAVKPGLFGIDLMVGSGVIIDSNGLVITALHVVEDATSVRVIYDDGTMVYAEGVLFDPNHDLAVLSLNHKSDKKAELYLGPPLKEKEHISHVGTPFGYLDDAYKEGSIINSQLYRLSLDLSVPYISASLEVVPGCSGGGVYYRGKLIGIVSRTIKETGQALIVPVNIQTLKLINTKFVELVPYK